MSQLDWIKARAKIIRQVVEEGRLLIIGDHVEGICEDCNQWKIITFDHIQKRSQGGSHRRKNIDFVCLDCHSLRDNMGDPKGKKKTKNKPDWGKSHLCKHCKYPVVTLICNNCDQLSI